MTTTPVRVDTAVLQRFLSKKPTYLTITGFVSQTLEQAADAKSGLGTVSLTGFENSEGTATEQKAVDVRPTVEPINKEKTPRAKKPKAIVPNADDVPEELKAHADLLLDYWAHRKGDATRTQRAWNSRMKEAAEILKDHGEETFLAHVNKAADAGWHGLHPEYIAQEKLASETGAPESKHPAYRDASEVLRESERIAQENIERIRRERAEKEASWPPSQTGGKGVLEPGAF